MKKTGFQITFDDGVTQTEYLQAILNSLKRFVVHARRPIDYETNGSTKEFGFDWLRDEYINPVNTITYDLNGNKLPTALNNQTLCVDPEALKSEYLSNVLNPISPYDEQYYPSWLSLEKNKHCFLDIEIEELEQLAPLTATKIVLETTDNSIELDKSSIDLSSIITNSSLETKNTGNGNTKNYHKLEKAIKVSCVEDFSEHKQIKIFAECESERIEVGKIMIYNNKDIYKLKARFVEVKFKGKMNYTDRATTITNKFNFNNNKSDISSTTVNIPENRKSVSLSMGNKITEWKNYIKNDEKKIQEKFIQSLIKYEPTKDDRNKIDYKKITVDFDNFQIGNNINSTGTQIDRVKDSISSLTRDTIVCDMLEFINGLKEIYISEHNEENGIIVFLMPVVLQEPNIKNPLHGFSDDVFSTGKYILLNYKSSDFKSSTLAHEAAHTMGLFHSFQTDGIDEGRVIDPCHTFNFGTTDNIMDYSNNTFCFFKWQWDKLRLDNNDLELI